MKGVLDKKYDMTREENVFLVKRNIVDIIWKQANLEGIAVTYPDTCEIYEGRTVAGLTLNETKAINNLKHAWEFVLDNLDAGIDVRLVRHINGLVGAEGVIIGAGELRMTDVSIGGTDWRPAIPDYETVSDLVRSAMDNMSHTEQALEMFCEICRGQWFMDGNKRTAQLVANSILVRNACGILAIPQKSDSKFKGLLVDYYESGDKAPLIGFLYESAIDGADFSRQRAATLVD